MRSNVSLVAPMSQYLTGRLATSTPVRVTDIRRIAVGHSRAMFAVTAEIPAGEGHESRRYVLRMEQGGVFGTDSYPEVRLMRALRGAGYPVAPVPWYEPDRAIVGEPFFLMDFLDGQADTPSEADARAYIHVLHDLHQLPWQDMGLHFLDVPISPRDGALQQVERWYNVYREGRYSPIPLIEEGRAWLRRHAPAAAKIAIVHGDSGPANFMYSEGKVTCVTDWEFAHLGDPIEDWVYMAAMRGRGLFTRERWAEVIQEEVGVTITDAEWTFWDAFNHFKGACANITCLRVFSSGLNPAPNMAAIGTALHLVFLQRLAEIVGANP